MIENCNPINFDEFEEIPIVDFVLATAVKIELETMFHHLTPMPGENAVTCIHWHSDEYYLGMCGKYKCCLVMSEAGGLGRHGSSLVILDAIDRFTPHGVILCGIAFGLFPSHKTASKKQVFGDVLVSTHAIIYEKKKLDNESEIYRGPIPESGRIFSQRINHFSWDWTYRKKQRSFIKGAILSGEKLVNNVEFREKLIKEFPTAVGGEMEGVGLYSAAQRRNVEWLIIKAICDFAENKNDDAHLLAAKNACDFVAKFLNQPGLEAKHFGVNQKQNFKSGITSSDRNGNFEAFYRDVTQAKYINQERALKLSTFLLQHKKEYGENPWPKILQEEMMFLKTGLEVAKENLLSIYNDGCARYAKGKFDKDLFVETFNQEINQIFHDAKYKEQLSKNRQKLQNNPYKSLEEYYALHKNDQSK